MDDQPAVTAIGRDELVARSADAVGLASRGVMLYQIVGGNDVEHVGIERLPGVHARTAV